MFVGLGDEGQTWNVKLSQATKALLPIFYPKEMQNVGQSLMSTGSALTQTGAGLVQSVTPANPIGSGFNLSMPNTTTLLLIGAGVLGAILLFKGRRRRAATA